METESPIEAPFETLDPRSIQVDRIAGWILTASVALGSFVGVGIAILVADSMSGWLRVLLALLWIVSIALLGLHTHRWPVRAFQHTFYRVNEDGIEIRRGVYWRVTINVPRSRVQHTDVSQGPVQRRYGLATLVVYTAGTDYARIDLPGLDHAVALRLRERLLPSGEADAV